MIYMKREFKLDFSGMLGIFVAGVVIGILGTILFSAVKDVPTSDPHSIFRDFYLLVARISYQVDIEEFAKEYANNELAANQKYKGKTVYISGYVEEFTDENGIPVVHLDIGYYGYGRSDSVKLIACQMQKRMLPILAKREKGERIGIVGEVVGLSSEKAAIYLKNCLSVPTKEELDGSQ